MASKIPQPQHRPPPSVHFPSDGRESPVGSGRPLSLASGVSGQSSPNSFLNDTRRKQNKRDEAIRKKIEAELGRKRTISTNGGPGAASRNRRGGKVTAAKGTVAALKPLPALTVSESISVSDASQLCAAKRTDCVLVVDEDESLSGIFTAKDLAYRVTAEGLDPRTTPVSAIMTRGPMVTRDTTSATEALQLMVQRGFRHLPVCNEDGNVMGLLDITKVFHEALDKVERGSTASQKLYNALEGVQSELGGGLSANPQAAAMLAYVEALREKTALPDLTTVMDSRTHPATVTPKQTVREAARLMKERRTTAVCIVETSPGASQPKVVGIFTSKDVVLRVIAAGLEPSRCSVVRVMTPHPDVAAPTMTVQDALKRMYVGHYLNLPVVEDDGRLVAIVDVLKLTYATLEQMNSIATGNDAGTDGETGPMWGRFFDSFAGHNDDNESIMSGSHIPPESTQEFSVTSPTRRMAAHGHHSASPVPDLHPNDSASAVNDAPSVIEYVGGAPASTAGGAHSTAGAPIPVDDGTYVFKFRTPSGRTHRFQARSDNYENIIDIVQGKLLADPFFEPRPITLVEGADITPPTQPDPSDFTLSYTDSDGDTVLISTDSDVADAVRIARSAGSDRVVLFLQGGKAWEEAGSGESEKKAKTISHAAHVVEEEVAKAEATSTALPDGGQALPPPASVPGIGKPSSGLGAGDDLFGIPRDMVLPASMGFLGVVIVGVFIASRMTARDF